MIQPIIHPFVPAITMPYLTASSCVLVQLLLSLALVLADVPCVTDRHISNGSGKPLKTKTNSPDTSCSRSPVMAPTTASFLPVMRSAVPSTYPLAWAALYSASPWACSSLPDWDQEVAPVRSPMVSTTVPLREWNWPLTLLHGTSVAGLSRSNEGRTHDGSLVLAWKDMLARGKEFVEFVKW